MELAGRRVLITGASRGVGAALAAAFTDAGSRVALVARSEAAIAELADRLGGAAYPADLADRGQVRDLVARVEADGGPIDVLVNNAGFEEAADFARQNHDAIDAMIDVNLVAAVQLTRQVVPGMLERGAGHIVNISSMGAASVFPGLAVYSATKAGLSHFTAGLRADFRGRPIETTLVELGAVATEMLDSVKRFGPTLAAFDRAYGWHVFVDTSPERVAEATIAAVCKGRRHVRLPTRAALFPAIAELPRRLTEMLLTGAGAEIR